MTTRFGRNPEQQLPGKVTLGARVRGSVHGRLAWLFFLCLLVAGGLGYYLIQPGDGEPSPPPQRPGGRRQGSDPSRPMPVTAVPAKASNVGVYLNGLGSVTPIATVTVRTRIDGQLMKVLFREGQIVRAGDLLAEIDPRTYEAQLQQAEGQMARDQALLANALLDRERYRVLFAQDSVAKQQLDTQEALVRQYEGTAKVDQAAVDTAKLQLTYCRITAPISGRLGLRLVDPGNIVHAGDANGLVVITQLQPIGVVFTIPEDSLQPVMQKLRAGEKLAVDAYDRSDKVKLASGTLLTVDNQIDPATGTVKLKAQFANEAMNLFPNQFANVHMLLDVKRDATVVSSAAIQRGTPGTFVYVVKPDNTVTVRVVKPGPTQGDDVSIEAGLAPGEQVVVDGADKLREGAKVEPVAEQGKATTGRGGARKGGGGGGGGNKGRQRREAGTPGAPVPATSK